VLPLRLPRLSSLAVSSCLLIAPVVPSQLSLNVT
jgi:hypothetical protein